MRDRLVCMFVPLVLKGPMSDTGNQLSLARGAIILVKRLIESEASCTGRGPRLIYMSIMSRISSFETCFSTRLARVECLT
jgi:hypothetical protein